MVIKPFIFCGWKIYHFCFILEGMIVLMQILIFLNKYSFVLTSFFLSAIFCFEQNSGIGLEKKKSGLEKKGMTTSDKFFVPPPPISLVHLKENFRIFLFFIKKVLDD